MTEPKRLYRSRTDRKIAGVCGGLAEYFNIDPVIVRIVAVILLLPGGLPGLLPYVILWLVVPEGPEPEPDLTPKP
jgi:phage shock protein PspC (stress-responsive transcriptional regulator)